MNFLGPPGNGDEAVRSGEEGPEMSRPASRQGLGNPIPMTAAAGPVPGTAGGLRPGTMSRGLNSRSGAPPGTAARLRTGAIPSTPGTQAAYGVGLATELQVADRPVTQQGMRGMKTGALGPGRQVADQSYFVGVLRAKVNEITAELKGLKAEVEQFTKDSSQYSQYERKYEGLLKEVRNLEGTLADYNLAMDKLRTSTDPEEVRGYHRQVESKNKKEAQEIDRVFLIKQQREKETAEAEGQILALQRQAEAKVNQLEPRKLMMYRELVQRANALQEEAQQQQETIEATAAQIRHLSDANNGPSFNDQFAALQKRLAKLHREKKELDEDMTIAQMNPKDAHAKLLAKVKEDNKQLAELDQKCKLLKEEIALKRKHLTDLATDIAERRTGDGSDSQQKYEVLYKRDQEMTEFIDKFDEAKQAIQQDQAQVQQTIVALLEHVSQGLEVEGALPTEQRFKEMKDEVSFKEKQLESSQVTMARLIEERNKRIQELEKINTLDEKIAVELGSIQNRVESMQKEMMDFEDIEGLRGRAEATQTYLSEARKGYIRRRDSIKLQVQLLSSAYDSKKKTISGNEVANMLDSLEQKLKHYEQSIFGMQEYIESKVRETDFQSVKDECLRFTTQLNKLHKQIDEPSMKAYSSMY